MDKEKTVTWQQETRNSVKMEDSENFLNKIFNLLKDGGVFDIQNNEKKKVIDFRHPDEMKVSETLIKDYF